jgi:hypothetical protein
MRKVTKRTIIEIALIGLLFLIIDWAFAAWIKFSLSIN